MTDHGIHLRDASFGEQFCYLDPGYIFFPHDFHHPLANLWLGLSDRLQRNRLRDPRHRGNHGHLPHFETERSFAMMLEGDWTTERAEGRLEDVAPSAMNVLGHKPFPSMTGTALFARAS
jgi:hypothetical protein